MHLMTKTWRRQIFICSFLTTFVCIVTLKFFIINQNTAGTIAATTKESWSIPTGLQKVWPLAIRVTPLLRKFDLAKLVNLSRIRSARKKYILNSWLGYPLKLTLKVSFKFYQTSLGKFLGWRTLNVFTYGATSSQANFKNEKIITRPHI